MKKFSPPPVSWPQPKGNAVQAKPASGPLHPPGGPAAPGHAAGAKPVVFIPAPAGPTAGARPMGQTTPHFSGAVQRQAGPLRAPPVVTIPSPTRPGTIQKMDSKMVPENDGIVYNPADWPADAPQTIYSAKKKTEKKILERYKENGSFWAKDKSHKKYLLMTHYQSGKKYFVHKKVGGDGTFHPAMRFSHQPQTMQEILIESKEKEALSYGEIQNDFQQPLFVNTADRTDQPGNVMGQWLGREGVKAAYEQAGQATKNYNYVSASIYAGELDWEWLHLRAHSLGGQDVADNLVAGSKGANTIMLAIENALYEFSGLADTTINVTYRPEIGTRWGKTSRKANYISYKVYYKNNEVFNHEISAHASSPMALQYESIKNEALAVLQMAAGKVDAMINFYKNNANKFVYGYTEKFDG